MANYCSGIPFFLNDDEINSLGILSYAVSKSTNTIIYVDIFLSRCTFPAVCTRQILLVCCRPAIPKYKLNVILFHNLSDSVIYDSLPQLHGVCHQPDSSTIPTFQHRTFPLVEWRYFTLLHDWDIPSTSTAFIVCRK